MHLHLKLSVSYIGRIRKHVMEMKRRRLALVAQRRASDRVQLQRSSFRRAIQPYVIDQLVFVDETHVDRRNFFENMGI